MDTPQTNLVTGGNLLSARSKKSTKKKVKKSVNREGKQFIYKNMAVKTSNNFPNYI